MTNKPYTVWVHRYFYHLRINNGNLIIKTFDKLQWTDKVHIKDTRHKYSKVNFFWPINNSKLTNMHICFHDYQEIIINMTHDKDNQIKDHILKGRWTVGGLVI